jgi:hypothetical protein
LKKNIFKYLRKKVYELSEFSLETSNDMEVRTIYCLGFEEKFYGSIPKDSHRLLEGVLIDRLVENPEFLKKLEQLENRKENLKTLLD